MDPKRRAAGLIAALFLLFALVSCAGETQEIVGRWETAIEDEDLGTVEMVYHFTEEGEIFLEQKAGDEIPFSIPFGSYEIRDGKLTVSSDGSASVYTFSVTENTLTLSAEGAEDVVFRRV